MNNSDPIYTRYLKKKHVAKALHCSERKLEMEIKAGALPVIRKGRMVFIDRDDLVAYMEAGKTK